MEKVVSLFKFLTKYLVKIIITIVIIIISVILLDYLGLTSYYFISKNNFEELVDIPGLDEGYIPQGLCFINKDTIIENPDPTANHPLGKNLIFQTSYSDNNPSKLYIIDFDTKETVHSFQLKNSKGEDIYNHVGGVTINNKFVWITGDSKIFIYDFKTIASLSSDSINSMKEFDLPNLGDFCFYHYNKMNDNPHDVHYYNILWIGEFTTNITPSKKNHEPLLYGYNLDTTHDLANFDNPDYTITLPRTVQGMCIDKDNNFLFSRSYSGFFVSSIDIYENMLDSKVEEKTIGDKKIQYHSYENSRRIDSISVPPMSEGIYLRDNKLYVVFESAAKKYLYAIPKINKILEFKLKE